MTDDGGPLAGLPDGWVVWSEEPEGRVVLAFRPDVFDTNSFPAPCLPTMYVTDGSPRPRPGAGQVETGEWHVRLFMEPEIEVSSATYDARDAALAGAVDAAERFVAGDVDYRDAYQVPREAYFDRLDGLTGGD